MLCAMGRLRVLTWRHSSVFRLKCIFTDGRRTTNKTTISRGNRLERCPPTSSWCILNFSRDKFRFPNGLTSKVVLAEWENYLSSNRSSLIYWPGDRVACTCNTEVSFNGYYLLYLILLYIICYIFYSYHNYLKFKNIKLFCIEKILLSMNYNRNNHFVLQYAILASRVSIYYGYVPFSVHPYCQSNIKQGQMMFTSVRNARYMSCIY